MSRNQRRAPGEHSAGAETLTVLPLRDTVHFPLIVTTVHVARERSLKAVHLALSSKDKRMFVLSQKDMNEPEPGMSSLHEVGVLSELLQAAPFPDGTLRLVLRGVRRVRVSPPFENVGAYWAKEVPSAISESAPDPALLEECKECFVQLVPLSSSIPPEAAEAVAHLSEAGILADTIAHYLTLTTDEKQAILAEFDSGSRLASIYQVLRQQWFLAKRRQEIRTETDTRIAHSQRDFVLREQLKTLQGELFGAIDPHAELRGRLETSLMPEEPRRYASEQVARLQSMGWDSAESAVTLKHVECLLSIPWQEPSPDTIDLAHAKRVLDVGHLKLDEVKERVLDFLAVRKLTRGRNGAVLCFEGPPGVGKTTLAAGIAKALGRPLMTLSLGGLRDEAELRGHRRTYVGAAPGRIAQGIIACGSRNPVCVIDEIDKIGSDGSRSDVASALLEILDPNLNRRFTDHFMSYPIDLSHVLFIATANTTDGLPPALKDRLEVVEIGGYSAGDRLEIARTHLLPRALAEHGLTSEQLQIDESAMRDLARQYTNEPGVRQLERALAMLARKAARAASEGEPQAFRATREVIQALIGTSLQAAMARRPGIGLAWATVVAALGGDAVQIEAATLEPLGAIPEIRLTGNMGNVMRESAETAVSFLRGSTLLGPRKDEMWRDIHIHASRGDRAKEGPSAGLAIAAAIYSAISGRATDPDVAMTGEISLHGAVLPVGGIREKVLAAHRLEFKKVLIPALNMGAVGSLPQDVRAELEICPVETVEEALNLAIHRLACEPVDRVQT